MDEPPALDVDAYVRDPDAELRRCAHAGWYTAVLDERGEPLPIVLGLDRVRSVLRDRRLSPRSFPDAMVRNGLSPEATAQFTPLFSRHGDEHRAHRGLLAAAFTPRRIEALRPAIAAVAARLADRIAADGGESDFVTDFAGRLPPEVFAHLFGLPEGDVDQLAAWASVIVVAFSPFLAPHQVEAIERTAAEMRSWAGELIAARRAAPADDLVTHLLEVELDGRRLDESEVVAVITGFVFAGAETTKRQLVELVAAFAVHPDGWRRLQVEPELVPNAVEEVLRLRPIVPALTRRAEEAFELDGLRVGAGGQLVTSFVTANRDADVFDDPDTFDIARERADGHVTFGWGPHFCLGAGLARVELQESLRALLDRFDAPVVTAGTAERVVGFTDEPELAVRFPSRGA